MRKANITEARVMARTGCLKFELTTFPTEQEAIDFCEYYGWEYQDEHEFVYELYID